MDFYEEILNFLADVIITTTVVVWSVVILSAIGIIIDNV